MRALNLTYILAAFLILGFVACRERNTVIRERESMAPAKISAIEDMREDANYNKYRDPNWRLQNQIEARRQQEDRKMERKARAGIADGSLMERYSIDRSTAHKATD